MEKYREEAIEAIRNLFDAGDGKLRSELKGMLEQVRDEAQDCLNELED
jgi:hypothetical protein